MPVRDGRPPHFDKSPVFRLPSASSGAVRVAAFCGSSPGVPSGVSVGRPWILAQNPNGPALAGAKLFPLNSLCGGMLNFVGGNQ
jgi:hypothetical protein